MSECQGTVAVDIRNRFMEKIRANAIRDDDAGCLIWTKGLRHSGHADTYISGTPSRRVHRVSYEVFVGPIGDGLEVDHICGMRSCIEPFHLRAVTGSVNGSYRTGSAGDDESGFRNVYRRKNGWVGIVFAGGEENCTEVFNTQREASIAVEKLREEVTGLAGYEENMRTLRSLWKLMKFDPSLSILPLYP